jgi:hypothetical protein
MTKKMPQISNPARDLVIISYYSTIESKLLPRNLSALLTICRALIRGGVAIFPPVVLGLDDKPA